MPKIEIGIEKTKENNELGEINIYQQQLQRVSNELANLVNEKNKITMGLNRVVKSVIDRAKLNDESIRGIAFPPYIANGHVLYTIIDEKLGISMPDGDPENIITEVKEKP